MNLMLEPPEPEPADKVSLWRSDNDLPGMWSHSDFEGGDPDEHSYAERGWSQRIVDFSVTPDVLWEICTPPTIETRNLAIETMELLVGMPLIPLSARKIPTRGTE